jgi:hypothetical protein
MHPPMDPDLIRDAARGQSMDDVLALWERATSERARCDDWIAIAFEIARRSRVGIA